MGQECFIVIQQGVYYQSVYGPYSAQIGAETAAQRLAKADRDDYHRWCVYLLTPMGIDSTSKPIKSYTRTVSATET